MIPAGYVGAAFWGGTFVALSGGARLGATICAALVICFLLVSLWYVEVFVLCAVTYTNLA